MIVVYHRYLLTANTRRSVICFPKTDVFLESERSCGRPTVQKRLREENNYRDRLYYNISLLA